MEETKKMFLIGGGAGIKIVREIMARELPLRVVSRYITSSHYRNNRPR